MSRVGRAFFGLASQSFCRACRFTPAQHGPLQPDPVGLAYWLHRCGLRPTVVEKASTVRPGGYPIDLRGIAVEVIDRMGLLSSVRAAHIATRRATCVDSRGRRMARMEL